jgi:hypothetical protein
MRAPKESVRHFMAAEKNKRVKARAALGTTQMLGLVDVLSRYFDGVKIIEFQLGDEQQDCALRLEAGGLEFEMTQSGNASLELGVYSADQTKIKLVYTLLPLDENGQIGPQALGMIKVREAGITPEGRKKLLMLDFEAFGKLYQDIAPPRRRRRR